MKFTEIPEHWNLSIMYKVNGLSRRINVKYKTKELAEQEMHKQWKKFCKRYDVAEKDLVMKYGTFCEYSKGMVHFDVWHDDETFEIHFTFKDTLVYDTLYLDSLIQVVSEITSTISKFEG